MNNKSLYDQAHRKEKIDEFFSQKVLRKIIPNMELSKSHVKKARSNMEFFQKNSENDAHYDWLIVILYYALYHGALALCTMKGYYSKNHTATLCVLIDHFLISKEETQLFEHLAITKDEAEFYTLLKNERHKASYNTKSSYSFGQILEYRNEVISFINKADGIITNESY